MRKYFDVQITWRGKKHTYREIVFEDRQGKWFWSWVRIGIGAICEILYRTRNGINNTSWMKGVDDGRRWASKEYEDKIKQYKEESEYSHGARRYWKARALTAEGHLKEKKKKKVLPKTGVLPDASNTALSSNV